MSTPCLPSSGGLRLPAEALRQRTCRVGADAIPAKKWAEGQRKVIAERLDTTESHGLLRRLFVKHRGVALPINTEDIIAIISEKDYCRVHLADENHLVHLPTARLRSTPLSRAVPAHTPVRPYQHNQNSEGGDNRTRRTRHDSERLEGRRKQSSCRVVEGVAVVKPTDLHVLFAEKLKQELHSFLG